MTQFKRKQESDIDPDDIWGNDAFGTLESYGTFLTNALVADLGNFVLNVNGAWGSGKTFFVNRWAEHLRQAGHPVVEFNAWENDNEADPLTSLLAKCLSSLEPLLPKRSALVKNLKQKGGRIALSLGNIATQAVLRKAVGDDGVKELKDLFSKETEQELIQLGGSLIQEQMKKKLEREAFTDELKALVLKLQVEQKAPIFIFIDELDRCRPIFAIELLERVKHLFGVDGIKFIITTDSQQLAHSICGAYGAGFDGTTYLRRFFDETFTLPEPDHFQFAKNLFTGTTQNWENVFADRTPPGQVFSNLSAAFAISLRDQIQVFHRTTAVLANIGNRQREVLLIYLLFLTMLRMKDPEVYDQLIRRDEKRPVWKEALRKITFKDSYYVTVLDWCFKYLDMTHADAGEHWRSASDNVSAHKRSNEDRTIRDIQQTILNNYNGLQEYPKYIELASTLS